jgi:hypothetical protein
MPGGGGGMPDPPRKGGDAIGAIGGPMGGGP